MKKWRRITGVDLSEMSLPKKKAFLKVSSLAYPIAEHIFKLLLFKDDQNYQKHLSDIENWLKQIQEIKLKPNNREISRVQYRDWLLLDGLVDDIEGALNKRGFIRSYQSLPRTDVDITSSGKLYKKIIERSSDLLSKNTLDDFEKQVWNKIMKGRK